MQAKQDSPENLVFEAELEVKYKNGLHMRPALKFVDIANRFDSDIAVSNGKTNADGKSIMQVTILAATYGTKLTIKATGPDAGEAIDALKEFMDAEHLDEPAPEQ